MSGRLHQLHGERDRARARVDWCRQKLVRFESYADPKQEHDCLMLCRLQRDLRVAEQDAGYAMLQLEDAMRKSRPATTSSEIGC